MPIPLYNSRVGLRIGVKVFTPKVPPLIVSPEVQMHTIKIIRNILRTRYKEVVKKLIYIKISFNITKIIIKIFKINY